MKLLTSITLAAGLAISVATAADAVPMPTLASGTTTDPTEIDNVVVDGTIYDVTFNTTTLNSFTQGSTLSVDASIALTDALNELKVTGLGGITPPLQTLADVDNSISSFDDAVCNTTCTIGGWGNGNASGSFNLGSAAGGEDYVQAADFAAVGTVGVPEPLTLSLFGAGLLGAAAIRRRKAK